MKQVRRQTILNVGVAENRDAAARLLEEHTDVEKVATRDDTLVAGLDDEMTPSNADDAFVIGVLLQTVDSLFHNVAESRNMELRVVPSSAAVKGGIIPLLRIVSNLVVNAINNGSNSKVLVGVRRRRQLIEVVVADNGPGIEECDQQRLFEKYEKSADSSGLGLGLSIVREIASQNGFDLSMASQLGSGTVFTVSVPIAQ